MIYISRNIFFDSILAKHPIPIWLPEEDKTTQKVKECIAKIEEFRKGTKQFFPDSLVSECLRSISFNTAIINNHGPEYTDMVYGECLMMCAAFYSPDVSSHFVNHQFNVMPCKT